jgi:hypothetical protein
MADLMLTNLRQQHPGEDDSQLLLRAMHEHESQLSFIQKQKQKIHEAEAEAANAREELLSANQLPASRVFPSEEKKTATLPKPPIFGGDRIKYKVWKSKMHVKLRRDVHVIGEGDRAQVDYVCAFVEDEAAEYLQYYTNRMGDDVTIEGTWDYLDQRYHDPHREQRAMAEHDKFKQGNKPFPEFIAELDRLQSEAGIDPWPTEVKINILKTKVSNELIQLSVANVNLSATDYGAVVSYFNQLHNNLAAAKSQGAFRYDIHGHRLKDKADPKPATSAPPIVQHAAAAGRAQKDPNEMDWTSNKGAFNAGQGRRKDDRPRPPEISEAEFNSRQQRGACYNCGNTGHIAPRCFYGPPPRKGVRTFKIMTTPPEIVMLEDKDEKMKPPSHGEQSKE